MALEKVSGKLENAAQSAFIFDSVKAWLSNYNSEHTRQAYARVLEAFKAFNDGKLLEASKQDVIDYRDYLVDELQRANTTTNLHLYAIRAFYRHLVDKSIMEDNPAADVKTRKVTAYGKTKSLSIAKKEHLILLDSIDTANEMGARDYAIILLLLTTGLRVSAIADARISDIEQSGERVFLKYSNKGGEEKHKTIPPQAVSAMKDYLSWRVLSEKSPLFSTIRGKSGNSSQTFGKAMSRVAISKMITKRARQAGVSNISAHSLRHTAALYLQTAGESVSAIQKFLEHSDKRTTLIYLDHLEDDSEERLSKLMDGISGS